MKIELATEQEQALACAGAELDRVRASVGIWYMRLQEARRQMIEAEAHLENRTKQARTLETSYTKMVGEVVQGLDLPPGRYEYKEGFLIRSGDD